MILKQVTAAEQEQALADMRQKMRLEDIFTPLVIAFLAGINQDFERFFRTQGRVLDVEAYRQQLGVLLSGQYARTAGAFEGRVLLPPVTDEDLARIAALRDAVLNPALADKVPVQSDFILSTVDNRLNSAVKIVERDLPQLTTAETAAASAAHYGAQIPAAAEGIAITETQAVAELTKFSEITAAAAVLARIANGTWATMGDADVRPDHADARGQERLATEPFDVGGEQLRFPGDTLLGATVGNVAGCRCSVIHGFTA